MNPDRIPTTVLLCLCGQRERVRLTHLGTDREARTVEGVDRRGELVTVPLDDVAHLHLGRSPDGQRRTIDCRPPPRRRRSEET
jgi:hypothetical protein